MEKTAILVDGGFYRKRSQYQNGKLSPEDRVKELIQYCHDHLKEGDTSDELYRIFYYDCPPIGKKVFHPFLNKEVDLEQTAMFQWMNEFLFHLKNQRKLALRLGRLSETQAYYGLKQESLKRLCAGIINFSDLKEFDFQLNMDQKGVDMKIGIDIASMAYKKQVDRIILISGDSDFVPASKLARREGVDVILDPMGSDIKPDLLEHIDGLRNYNYKPYRKP